MFGLTKKRRGRKEGVWQFRKETPKHASEETAKAKLERTHGWYFLFRNYQKRNTKDGSKDLAFGFYFFSPFPLCIFSEKLPNMPSNWNCLVVSPLVGISRGILQNQIESKTMERARRELSIGAIFGYETSILTFLWIGFG